MGGEFLFGREIRVVAPSICFARACILLATAPTAAFLFPPLAAVAAVASHSIARPIALRQQGPTPADGPQRKSPPTIRA